jgi:hypothetical protein
MRDSVGMGLAKDPSSHHHPTYGFEMRLRNASYYADIVIADGAFEWYHSEDVEMTEPTEAGSVLVLPQPSAPRPNSRQAKPQTYIHG